jgi:tRNA uracil 4-sulfurtransferase
MGLILVRYGEIALKGKNRPAFTKQLRRNIRSTLKSHEIAGDVHQEAQRIYVETDDPDAALHCLRRVFGIVSLSRVIETPLTIDAMREVALGMAGEFGLSATHTFKAESRRSDKSFPIISPEINRLVGGVVQEATGATVQLKGTPDFTIGIEVQKERALMYGDVVAGPGGLPIPMSGRVIALMSGGIDSPVAAWMMMKRGCGVIPLHFSQNPLDTAKALDNCEALAGHSQGWRMEPIVMSHAEVIEPILETLHRMGAGRWACVMCKRAMLQKAEEMAQIHDAQAIVMGDSLGQVASQTLDNLEVVSYGITKPILRPLVGMDKTEITALARQIGTFDVSTRTSTGCTYLPARPLTKGSLDELKRILAELAHTDARGITHDAQ